MSNPTPDFTAPPDLTPFEVLFDTSEPNPALPKEVVRFAGNLGFPALPSDRTALQSFERRSASAPEGLPFFPSRTEMKIAETDIKYGGYLAQQQQQMERMKKAETRHIPAWFEYKGIPGLSREMVEKLTRVRPRTLGQASRIPGVTPAAVSIIHVYVEMRQRAGQQNPSETFA